MDKKKRIKRKLPLLLALIVALCTTLAGCNTTDKSQSIRYSSTESKTSKQATSVAQAPSKDIEKALESNINYLQNESKETEKIVKQYPRESKKMDDLALYDKTFNRKYCLGCSKSDFNPSEFGDAYMPLSGGTIGYNGVDVGIKEDKLVGFSLYEETDSKRFTLTNNLSIGSTRAEVLKTFGSPTTGVTGGSVFNYVYFDENNQLTIMDPNVKDQPEKYQDTSHYYYLNIMFDGWKMDSKITGVFIGDYNYMNPM